MLLKKATQIFLHNMSSYDKIVKKGQNATYELLFKFVLNNLALRNASPATIKSYRSDLEQFIDFFDITRLKNWIIPYLGLILPTCSE